MRWDHGMWISERQNNYQAFVLALVLHIALLIFIVTHFNSHFTTAQLNAGQNVKIIQAYAVMEPVKVQPLPQPQAAPPPPPAAVQSQKPPPAAKEVIFKSNQTPPAKPKPAPLPQPKVVKPVPKTPAKPQLTEAQRMQQIAEKLQAQARQSLQQQAQQEQSQLAQQLAQAQRTQGVVDKYKALILQQVGQNWVVPEINKDISCRLLITLAPGGTVLNVKLVQSSGNDALDRSAIQAVYKASPLPVPKESDAFNAMRELDMVVRPESAVSKIG